MTDPVIYRPDQLEEMLSRLPAFSSSAGARKVRYIDAPCSFDIESTSFTENGQKRATMYEWSFCIYGLVMIGRTWEEWEHVMLGLAAYYHTDPNYRLRIYVHNLSFEFGFFGYRWKWEKVFAVDVLKPVSAVLQIGIEFRCSYILSGYSLAMLGDQLLKYHVRKLEGDLDYDLPRHSNTPLTAQEIAYCIADVRVVVAYIQECIEAEKGLGRIPLTKTGYVRRYCRNMCLPDGKCYQYVKLMERLTLTVPEYRQLRRGYQGGFTHANARYVGEVVHDVTSYDFTSSYPYALISEKYPMTKARLIDNISKEEFYKSLKLYCCLFDVTFYDLEPVISQDYYLSSSRCWNRVGADIYNGRVVSAAQISTTLTEQDFDIIRQVYKWSRMEIQNFRRYQRAYLPKPFVESILQLYQDKTQLKGVSGKEAEYMISKGMLNSAYGMTVTDIARDEYIFPEFWEDPKPADLEKSIEKYNTDKKRFLHFPWGVWCCAYARHNLWEGILAAGSDYVYADTDSIKILNGEKHLDFIEGYNRKVMEKLRKAMAYHDLPFEAVTPKTIKGKEKPLGVWDLDGKYDRFKTLGAKRYMVEELQAGPEELPNDPDHQMSLTVSGLNKVFTMPYLRKQYGSNDAIFDAFDFGLYVPPEMTGKHAHTYIRHMEGELTDYNGEVYPYSEASGVHLQASDYTMSITQNFYDFLMNLRTDAV